MRSFGCIDPMISCAMARASPKRLPIPDEASTETSHAVPTLGWPCTLPQLFLSTNVVSVSAPATLTNRWALPSGNGNGSQRAPGFSSCALQQLSVAAPVTPAQGGSTSDSRLNCTTSSTVVSVGLPLLTPARGSIRRMCASGAAPALLANEVQTSERQSSSRWKYVDRRVILGRLSGERVGWAS